MRTTRVVRAVLGVLWLVLAGTWLALGYVLAAGLCAVLPVSRGHVGPALQMADYVLWPFGVALRAAPGADDVDPRGRTAWLLLAGWWLVVLHLVTAVLLAVAVVGLPLALLDASLVPAAARPRGLRLDAWPVPAARRRSRALPQPQQPVAV